MPGHFSGAKSQCWQIHLGEELLPHRWGCTMPRVMVWAPKVPPEPHPLADMDSNLTFASPVIITRCPLVLHLGGLLP